jgi:hypothetical protein
MFIFLFNGIVLSILQNQSPGFPFRRISRRSSSCPRRWPPQGAFASICGRPPGTSPAATTAAATAASGRPAGCRGRRNCHGATAARTAAGCRSRCSPSSRGCYPGCSSTTATSSYGGELPYAGNCQLICLLRSCHV